MQILSRFIITSDSRSTLQSKHRRINLQILLRQMYLTIRKLIDICPDMNPEPVVSGPTTRFILSIYEIELNEFPYEIDNNLSILFIQYVWTGINIVYFVHVTGRQRVRRRSVVRGHPRAMSISQIAMNRIRVELPVRLYV